MRKNDFCIFIPVTMTSDLLVSSLLSQLLVSRVMSPRFFDFGLIETDGRTVCNA